jgi:hypothetical protein
MTYRRRMTSREQLLLHRRMRALRMDMTDSMRRLLRHVRHLWYHALQVLVSILTKEAWRVQGRVTLVGRRREWETWRRLLSDSRRRLVMLIVRSTRLWRSMCDLI